MDALKHQGRLGLVECFPCQQESSLRAGIRNLKGLRK